MPKKLSNTFTLLFLSFCCIGFIVISSLFQRSTTLSFRTINAMSIKSIPQYRVLAFGDSLTAGTSGYKLYPYAPYLQSAVNTKMALDGHEVRVWHQGIPGFSAESMVQNQNASGIGLRSCIRNMKDLPISLVIILAGTNDLAYETNEQTIADNVKKLHQICFDEGVPRTIAIGIPPSGYQSVNTNAAKLAISTNSLIEKFCQTNSEKASFQPFPFQFEKGGEYWNDDTLHLSEKGYKALGESLVDIVIDLLSNLPTNP